MGESNDEWGELASHDDDLAAVWDSYDRLPNGGENEILDTFVDRKRISIPALVRVGARLADQHVLAFAFPGGVKYRDMVGGKRWSYAGSTWDRLKIIPPTATPDGSVIVSEGETDAARLTELYPASAIAVQPAGAKTVKPAYFEQLMDYTTVYVGLDDDAAGNEGAAKWAVAPLPTARLTPPANDWCEAEAAPPLPTSDVSAAPVMLVPAGELVEMEVPDVVSWFDNAVLPVAGQLVLHGWIKSFKTFGALDMLSALAQGQAWCTFEPAEEACRVAVIQYEIPWAYYKQRVQMLRLHAHDRDAFDKNFLTWEPQRRPSLIAGNLKQEDYVLSTLSQHGVQVVMLDPLRRLSGTADLNAEHEVRKSLMFFERLQNEGITVVWTHHDNKDSAKTRGGDALGMTGSGAFGGDPDTVVSIELPRGENYRTSPRRNLNFTLRNGPPIGGRGMEMQEDGRILYSTEPFEQPDGDEDGAPAI